VTSTYGHSIPIEAASWVICGCAVRFLGIEEEEIAWFPLDRILYVEIAMAEEDDEMEENG